MQDTFGQRLIKAAKEGRAIARGSLPSLDSNTDFFTKHGAALLAQHITSYWRSRGYVVRTERFLVDGTDATWGVRSNLVNGLPRCL